jgi:copper chaperone CopZ
MHCQSCVNRVNQALKKVSGVDVLDVKIGAATLACRSEQEKQLIAEAVKNAGFHIASFQ